MDTSGTPLQYETVNHFGAFFTEPNLFDNNTNVCVSLRQYHSNLSDQSALKLGLRLWLNFLF